MFGKRIVELRKKLGLTQAELASSIGISRSALSLYEIEKREPDIDTLNKLASLFNVPVGYILGRETLSNETSQENENNYFFFFFNDLLKDIFIARIKKSLAVNKLSEDEFAKLVSFDEKKCKKYLTGECEPSLEDLIEISQVLDVSIDYLLGQIPNINNSEKKILDTFIKLEEDNKDIIIGKAKELLKEQQCESVAADEPLKKTGTDNLGK